MFTPAIRATRAASPLPLLVARVRADHEHDAAPPDHPAALTHRLYGRSNLHTQSSRVVSNQFRRKPAGPRNRARGHQNTALRPTENGSRAFPPAPPAHGTPSMGAVGAGCTRRRPAHRAAAITRATHRTAPAPPHLEAARPPTNLERRQPLSEGTAAARGRGHPRAQPLGPPGLRADCASPKPSAGRSGGSGTAPEAPRSRR